MCWRGKAQPLCSMSSVVLIDKELREVADALLEKCTCRERPASTLCMLMTSSERLDELEGRHRNAAATHLSQLWLG